MLKNRSAYLATVMLALMLVLVHESPLTYLFLYAVLLLPVLSWVTLRLTLGRLTLDETLASDTVPKGEAVTYTLRLSNRGFFPCSYVSVQFESTLGVTADLHEDYFSIAAGGQYTAEASVTGNYWGNYPVGVKYMRIYDFFGLFSLKQSHPHRQKLTVTPSIQVLRPLPIKAIGKSDQAQHLFNPDEDYSTVADIQPYQPSDGYKKIHWKASAKKNQLMSKQFGVNLQDYVDVFLDNSLTPLPPNPTEEMQQQHLAKQDALIEVTVSVLQQVTQHQLIVSLGALSLDSLIRDTFAQLYQTVSQLTFVPKDFAQYVSDQASRFTAHKNVVLVVQRLTPDMVAVIHELVASKHQAIVIYSESVDTTTALSLAQSHQQIMCLHHTELFLDT